MNPNPLLAAYDDSVRRWPSRAGAAPWAFVERPGPGRTLVLVHGSLGSEHAFFPLFGDLSSQFRLLSLRLPDVLLPDALLRDFLACLDALGVARATLLGTSVGGYIAQFLAAGTDRVDSLVPNCAMASLQHMPMPEPARIDELARMSPEAMRSEYLGPMWPRWPTEPAVQQHLMALVQARFVPDNPPPRLMGRVRFMRDFAEAPHVVLPPKRMLLVECEDDPLISPGARAEIKARYPRAHHLSYPWGGHFPYLTRMKEYAAEVDRFLRTLDED